jgi:hypothetical protein
MRKAGHDGCDMRFGFLGKRLLHPCERFVDPIDGVADIKSEIRRHLIVARTRRMKAARRRTNQVLEAVFDVHVYVFERYGECECSAFDLRLNSIEALCDVARVSFRYDASFGQHLSVRL